MNKQQLAAKIWESANKMRSKIEANEYKDYILGFIFYKYLSDKEEKWLHEIDYQDEDIKEYVNEEDEELVHNAHTKLGYFIAYENLFSTWINMGADFSVDNVRTALSSFSRLISPSHKKVFEGIFATLETGLSKLGDNTKSQTKAISDLIHLINDIPMDGKQDYDVLGFIYEYLISQFAANAGKKAGEFYTPHEVSLMMSEIIANHLKGHDKIRIYDPTSGSGSLLINIGRAISKYMNNKNNIRYYAQELKANTYNLTRMNLVMRGIIPDNIVTRNGDTLEDDWPYFEESDPVATYDPLYVDAVVSNPPYSQQWDPSGKENDPRYSRYGLAPKSKADYAFLLHDLYHLKPDGIMTIVLPHGVLFRGGEEGEIRKQLIEQNNIDAIIGLPANIFFGTGIPTIVMVLRQKRENTDVLIIDASKGFTKEGKNNKLRSCDIKKITDTVKGRLDIDKYSRKVSREEIRANDYNLNIPRYVDSSEAAESWDIFSTMFGGIPTNEIEQLDNYWREFPTLKEELFEINGSHGSVKVENIKKTIENNGDVKKFLIEYKNVFSSLKDELKKKLIDNSSEIQVMMEEDRIAEDILGRFNNVKLVDKYEAYEIFKKEYDSIAGDLELIQGEGKEAIRQVDPNMVIKKKNGKDTEVQEGWKGHIIPFELIQSTLLKEDVTKIGNMKAKLQEISTSYEPILSELSEDDKELLGDAVNENKDEFVFKNIKNTIKALKADGDSEYKTLIDTLKNVEKMNNEEKSLKNNIKKSEDELHNKSKETIENLTDSDVEYLLECKWINPIIQGIESLPENMISQLEKKLDELSKKYQDTFEDIENEIRDTEKELVKMLDELTGNDADMAGIAELKKFFGGDF